MKFIPLAFILLSLFSCSKENIDPVNNHENEQISGSETDNPPGLGEGSTPVNSPKPEETNDSQPNHDEENYPSENNSDVPPADDNVDGSVPVDSGNKPSDNNQENISTPYVKFKTYTIKSGEHSSNSGIQFLSKEGVKFRAVFNSSAEYKISDENQGDINKLYGFADGAHHHTNSARFGWRWYNNELQIFAYTYANGERSSKYLTSVQPDKDYEYEISIKGDTYDFSVNSVTASMKRGKGNGGRYYLYPYFGGNEKAPHDVNIKILEYQ